MQAPQTVLGGLQQIFADRVGKLFQRGTVVADRDACGCGGDAVQRAVQHGVIVYGLRRSRRDQADDGAVFLLSAGVGVRTKGL